MNPTANRPCSNSNEENVSCSTATESSSCHASVKVRSRCVLVAGGEIHNYPLLRTYLQPERDYTIFCDCGLAHAEPLGVTPDLIVGDFDSWDRSKADAFSKKDSLSVSEPPHCTEPLVSSGSHVFDRPLDFADSHVFDEPLDFADSHVFDEPLVSPKSSTPEIISLPREKDDTDSFFAVKEAIRRGFDDFLLLGLFGRRMDHSLTNLSLLCYLQQQGKTALAVDDYSEFQILSGAIALPYGCCSYFSLYNIDGNDAEISICGAKFPLKNAKLGWNYQYAISNEILPRDTARIQISGGRFLLIKDR